MTGTTFTLYFSIAGFGRSSHINQISFYRFLNDPCYQKKVLQLQPERGGLHCVIRPIDLESCSCHMLGRSWTYSWLSSACILHLKRILEKHGYFLDSLELKTAYGQLPIYGSAWWVRVIKYLMRASLIFSLCIHTISFYTGYHLSQNRVVEDIQRNKVQLLVSDKPVHDIINEEIYRSRESIWQFLSQLPVSVHSF